MRNGAIKDYRWHLWATRSGIAQGSPWAPTELVSTKPHTQHSRCSCKTSIGIWTSPSPALSPQPYFSPGAKHQDGQCQKLAASLHHPHPETTHTKPLHVSGWRGLSAFCGRGCRHSTMQSFSTKWRIMWFSQLFLPTQTWPVLQQPREEHCCSTNLRISHLHTSPGLPSHFFSYRHPTIFLLTACTCTYIQSIYIKC